MRCWGQMLRFQKGQEPHCSSHQPHLMLIFISCFSRRAGGIERRHNSHSCPHPGRQAGTPVGQWGLEAPQTISGPPEARFLGEAEAASHQTCSVPPGAWSLSPCSPLPARCVWGVQGRAPQGEPLLLQGPHAPLRWGESRSQRSPNCVCVHFLASLQVVGVGPSLV